MHYINYIRSYLYACIRKRTSTFPVSKQPTRMPNLIYIVTSSYNSQPCCFGIPIHPPPTPPQHRRHPPNPTLTGGVISAFVVEYYYFRERRRESLKERQRAREEQGTNRDKESIIKVRMGQCWPPCLNSQHDEVCLTLGTFVQIQEHPPVYNKSDPVTIKMIFNLQKYGHLYDF